MDALSYEIDGQSVQLLKLAAHYTKADGRFEKAVGLVSQIIVAL